MKKFTKLNEDFDFKQTESPKRDVLYLLLKYEGGDADTKHPEYHKFDFGFSEYKEHMGEINGTIDLYKKLKGILDGGFHTEGVDWKELEKLHGKEIIDLLDNVPNDPQSDYQFKCYLDSMELIGYDKEGNKHESYIR